MTTENKDIVLYENCGYSCCNCIWNDRCGSNYICEYLSPIDDFNDDLIGGYIEENRSDFYNEWSELIEYLNGSVKE